MLTCGINLFYHRHIKRGKFLENISNIDLVVKNALLVTCDPNHTVIADGAMAVSGKAIVWTGTSDELPPFDRHKSRVIDAGGKILMPGLINMHAHCGDSLFRGLVENLPLEQWLETVWKSQAVILTDKQNCRLGAELGIAELLLGGTTTIMDNYWHPGETIAVALEAGVRIATGGIFFDTQGMDGNGPEDRENDARELFEQYSDNPEIFIGTMPHGTYTVGPDTIKTAHQLAMRHDGFFSIHAAETRAEQQTIAERYQTSVIRHLASLDALGQASVLAHCVHIDDEEIDLLAESGTNVAHNPLSNLKLASGFAPVANMLASGINVALGTDGPVSGNDLNMWLAMRLAATIHKAAGDDPAAISSHQALHMATLNGAHALRAQDYLGSLEPGKRADFILVDISAPHAMPMYDPVNHLVFSAGRDDVTDVFISARQIVKDRKLLTLDISDIASRMARLQPQIVASLED